LLFNPALVGVKMAQPLFMVGLVPVFLLPVNLILCIALGSRGRAKKHLQIFTMTLMFGIFVFETELFVTVSLLAAALCEALDGTAATAALAVIIFLFASGMAMHVFLYRYMTKRIQNGHLAKGGEGYWGNRRSFLRSKVLQRLFAAVMLTSLALITLSGVLRIRWNTAWSPIAVFAAVFILLFLFACFSLLYANTLIRLNYLQRFGFRKRLDASTHEP